MTITPKHLEDLSLVFQRMDTVFRPGSGSGWLQRPNPLLDGRRPIDLIRGGETVKVIALLDSLADGVFA